MSGIFGIGVDIVETERIRKSVERHGMAFINRVFTQGEQDYCGRMKKSEIHYAARFAAKEAVAKSFGTGFGKDLIWSDAEVVRLESGQPQIVLRGEGKRFAEENGIVQVLISLSHSDHYAVAHAIALTA